MCRRCDKRQHDELLALLNAKSDSDEVHALRAVVELHKPKQFVMGMGTASGMTRVRVVCAYCELVHYPCPTIQAIEKELG